MTKMLVVLFKNKKQKYKKETRTESAEHLTTTLYRVPLGSLVRYAVLPTPQRSGEAHWRSLAQG